MAATTSLVFEAMQFAEVAGIVGAVTDNAEARATAWLNDRIRMST